MRQPEARGATVCGRLQCLVRSYPSLEKAPTRGEAGWANLFKPSSDCRRLLRDVDACLPWTLLQFEEDRASCACLCRCDHGAEGMRVAQFPASTSASTNVYFFVAALTCSAACLVALFEAEAAASMLLSAISRACSPAFLLASIVAHRCLQRIHGGFATGRCIARDCVDKDLRVMLSLFELGPDVRGQFHLGADHDVVHVSPVRLRFFHSGLRPLCVQCE